MKLKAEKLTLKYDGVTIFKNLSLSLAEGEILAVRGSNGSGKSSLGLCLAGLMEADGESVYLGGSIYYGEKNLNAMSLAERCRAVGIIFQNPDAQLFSPLVIEELAFAPENLAVPREEMLERIDEALDLLGITHLKNARTNTLSGGEKQLVAIASVLTMRPEILIADEITSRVDINKKDVVRNILKDFAAKGGGVILISHNRRDLDLADRVLTLERGLSYAD